MDLGSLKKMAPRIMWKHEALDFTPWLANNINELGKEIGLELEVENSEVSVGPYFADILAKDTGTDTYVIIENQLEKTDHDHLGKALMYASVLDASTIVWIATEFTEEHKKALDWLNDHTTEDIAFYGVIIELWQIDDSRMASKFNVISRPNNTVRQVARAKSNENLTERKKMQLEFWTDFRNRLEKTKKIPSLQTPAARHWYDVTLGKSGVHLSNTMNTNDNSLSIRVYVNNKIAAKMYPYLESRKDEAERMLGQKLVWNPNPDNLDKTITLTWDTDLNNKEKAEEALTWMVDNTVKFRDVFSKIVREFKG